MSERRALRALADRAGILEGYHSALDGRWVETRDPTREALLSAMGLDASSEAAAARRLAEGEELRRQARLEPVAVVREDRPEARRLVLGHAGPASSVAFCIQAEDGKVVEGRGEPDPSGGLELPSLGVGRYALSVRTKGLECRQQRFVVPGACTRPEERLGRDRAWGLWANLYSVRSGSNWGFGNLGDLAELARRTGAEGASFLGLNPLHALPTGAACPYQPTSRLFRHPLYLDPEQIPELRACPEARRLLESPGFRDRLGGLRGAARLDVGAVGAALDEVLELLHAAFAAGACGPERRRAFLRYREAQGGELEDFATFEALADDFAARGGSRDARSWPAAFRSPDAPAVRDFRRRHAARVERHAWVQFELDRQLGEAAREARQAGLALGLYTDLALGSDPGGSDAWAFPGLMARGARVGAPPDAFSREGQEWGFPPLDPAALRRDGHRLWVRLLEAGFRHAGALRIDHAMALRRLFWIPEGRPPAEGAYVRYPDEELLGILALESRRAGAAVVAEDLGTVPEGFAEQLADRGILSSRVLLFERDGAGFRPSDRIPERCLLTANTHDLPPLAALAGEEDLRLRRGAGHITDDASLERARAERAGERRALRERLCAEGWELPEEPDDAQLAAAVTAFLCSTPAVLVGLALDDLAGEREPVNLPGVPPERHASWTRRLGASLEALFRGPIARACLEAIPPERRAGDGGTAQPAS